MVCKKNWATGKIYYTNYFIKICYKWVPNLFKTLSDILCCDIYITPCNVAKIS